MFFIKLSGLPHSKFFEAGCGLISDWRLIQRCQDS